MGDDHGLRTSALASAENDAEARKDENELRRQRENDDVVTDEGAKRPRQKLRGYEFFKSIGSPKYVCAPMVDQSELAFRLLTRRYGCELAYTPMMHSRLFSENVKYRKQNFQTCPEDRPLVVQFCGDDPATMAKAAKFVETQCDAVDINLGCPQGIAKRGHYGAFLLEEGDLVTSIVRRMDAEVAVPVTCKIRLLKPRLEGLQDTLNLVYGLEAAGCSLLTLHGRTKEMKGQVTGPCDWEAVKIVKSRCSLPMFLNGGIETFEDCEKCMAETGVDGVMSSEALLETPSLFSGRHVCQDQLTSEYLELAKIYDASKSAVKSHLFRFLYAGLQWNVDIRAQLGAAKNLEEISAAAVALAERRKSLSPGDTQRPDKGWYLRYRRPLGDRSQEAVSRAARKAAATVAATPGVVAAAAAEAKVGGEANGEVEVKAGDIGHLHG
mmetsp:Transcript_10566/g.23280  ORF Transcript_10566/g.23280 Transcript_10566/m.23280 type:complete len:438 (-) Transcript_10566:34-1347(-)